MFVTLNDVLAALQKPSRTLSVQDLFQVRVRTLLVCRFTLSRLYSYISFHQVAITVNVTDPVVGISGSLITSVILTTQLVVNRLSCTKHLSGWLVEKVDTLLVGVVSQLTIRGTLVQERVKFGESNAFERV